MPLPVDQMSSQSPALAMWHSWLPTHLPLRSCIRWWGGDLGLWAFALSMWVFGTPGWLRWTRAERRILNDEFTQANRTIATRWALRVLLAGSFLECLSASHAWVAPEWWPIAMVSAALAAAGISFAVTDLRADA